MHSTKRAVPMWSSSASRPPCERAKSRHLIHHFRAGERAAASATGPLMVLESTTYPGTTER